MPAEREKPAEYCINPLQHRRKAFPVLDPVEMEFLQKSRQVETGRILFLFFFLVLPDNFLIHWCLS